MTVIPHNLPSLLLLAVLVVFLIWFIVRSVKKAEDPARIVFKWVLTGVLVPLGFLAVPIFGTFGPLLFGVILAFVWLPHIIAGCLKPLTSLFDGGDQAPDPRPVYSIAQSKQKQGRYLDAIAEIRKQLQRFPTDFEGHLLLAQIQAENLQDLPGAELTLQRFCAQPGHAPANIAFAFYSLADWYLKFSQDPEAARRALQKVIDVLPDTEFALTAAQRIAHLGDGAMALASHDRKKFSLPHGVHNLGLAKDQPSFQPAETDPGQLAAEYVKHLAEHPLDTEVREKLAAIYADHYGRLDLASDQLEQLIECPNQPARLIVRWLNLLADIQIRCGADYDTVRQTLQRIIDR
ncbi:MAG TPA: hypothetical protein VNT26_22145, partial [Candidatus Sulfotelmatobacter sp.]|nr:hypothetical protein [Candidatus Sulfotelmatobacter sp.]